MVVHHVAPSPGLMPLALIDHPTRRISRKPMNRFATAFFRWRRYCNTPSLNPLLLQAASSRQKFFGRGRTRPRGMKFFDRARGGHGGAAPCLLADISAPRFAERTLWNVRRDHSGLIPANWITFAHFSDSA